MWKLMVVPVVGAVIGYATNWIAVKMLFKPYREVRVLGWKVPFTPGVIPKGQPRLARAVGNAVNEQLLTYEVMRDLLLSDEIKYKLRSSMEQYLTQEKSSDLTLHDIAETYLSEEKLSSFEEYVTDNVSEYIFDRCMAMDPGRLITEKVMEVAKEKLSESMFGMMLGGSLLESIGGLAEEKINEYLKENGKAVVKQEMEKEMESLQNKTKGEALLLAENAGMDISEIVLHVYEKLITERLEGILSALRLNKVVEERINSMEVEEVEELVLSIMKKELGAIVNIGALIGFVLGLINVAILLI